jgi:hypothetical protein
MKRLWYHSPSPISESHVISYTQYHMWYWMSYAKLSTPLSKQLDLALHSRRFQEPRRVHGGPACRELLRELHFQFSCQGPRVLRRLSPPLHSTNSDSRTWTSSPTSPTWPTSSASSVIVPRDPARKQPVVNADETAPAADNHEEAT